MSATLAWKNTALAAKTGTTNAACITDMQTAVDSLSGDSSFTWKTASSSTAGPLYLVLKPKDGSVGRLLFVIWATAPAGNNAAILGAAPVLNALGCAWFPNGNVDSPSNLTAASGTILGDDTGVVKLPNMLGVAATIYAANIQVCAFAAGTGGDGGVVFNFCNPAAAANYACGGGKLCVDAADTAVGCTFGTQMNTLLTGAIQWQTAATSIPAGNTTTLHIRTNYDATDDLYFQMWAAGTASQFAQTVGGANDMFHDTTNSKVWFVPITLSGRNKGQLNRLKFRQFGWGPPTNAAYASFNKTGPVLDAVQMNGTTAGNNTGGWWFVNEKL